MFIFDLKNPVVNETWGNNHKEIRPFEHECNLIKSQIGWKNLHNIADILQIRTHNSLLFQLFHVMYIMWVRLYINIYIYKLKTALKTY